MNNINKNFKTSIKIGTDVCYQKSFTAVNVTQGNFKLTLDESAAFNSNSGVCNTVTSFKSLWKVTGNKELIIEVENASSVYEAFGAIPIESVPYAMSTNDVEGFASSNLLRVENTGTPGTAPAITSAQATELINLLNGVSTVYVKPGSAVFTAAPKSSTAPTANDDLANKAYVDAQVAAGLPNVGTAGTYTKVTTDAQGRVTIGATLAESDIPNLITAGKVSGGAITSGTIGGNAAINTTGNIVTGATVSGNLMMGNQLKLADNDGTYHYVNLRAPTNSTADITFTLPNLDGTPGQFLKTDGSGNLSWDSAAGSGVTSVGATAPINSSGGATPTISISQASSTTDGYLSSTDWNTFNNKLGTASTFSGDVSGTSSTLSVDKIKGTNVTITSLTTGNFLKYNGTAWVNTNLAAVDIPSLDMAKITTGTLSISQGGTGQSTANAALNALLPTQATHSGKVLQTDGTNTSWVSVATGDITDVVAGAGLTGGATSGSATLTVDATTSAANNKILQLNGTGVAVVNGTQLNGSTSGNLLLQAAGVTTTYSLFFPPMQGSNGQTLQNNGSGVLTWVTPSSTDSTKLPLTGGAMTGAIDMSNQSIFNVGALGVGAASVHTSAIMDMSSTVKGILIPRMTTAQRDAIASPATGLQIYNTSNNQIDYYNGSAWVPNLDSSILGLAANKVPQVGGVGISANALLAANGTGTALIGLTCIANEVLKWSGSAWACSTDNTGGAPGDATYAAKGIVQFQTDAATSGINVTAGLASINTGTAANQIVKLPAASTLPAVDLNGISATGIVKRTATTGTYSTAGTISLASEVSGVLPVASGGTGSSAAPTSGGVIYASSGTQYASTVAGTTGQLLTSGGVGAPSWSSNFTISGANLTANSVSVISTSAGNMTLRSATGSTTTVGNSAGTSNTNIVAGTTGQVNISSPLNITTVTSIYNQLLSNSLNIMVTGNTTSVAIGHDTNVNTGIYFPNSGAEVGLVSLGSEKLRVTSSGISIGATSPVDTLSFSTAPIAGSTRALINLSNTTLSSGNANGTYIGANPAASSADFINFQVAGTTRFKVNNAGVIYGDGSGLTGISGVVSGLTAGRVALSTGATVVGDSSNLTFNAVTGALGIAGTSPAFTSTSGLTLQSASGWATTIGNNGAASSTNVQSGSGGINLVGNTSVSGTNMFTTGTGAVSLNGNTTLASNQNFTMSPGTGIYNQSYSGTTGTAKVISANALTSGSILDISTSSASLNSTNGLLRVANTTGITSGIIARLQSNNTIGSGLTVLANGNVGVGTTSPSDQFHVKGGGISVENISTGMSKGISITATESAAQNSGFLYFNRARPGALFPQTGDRLGGILAGEAVNNNNSSAAIYFTAAENQSEVAAGGNISFFTTANGSISQNERMTISQNGNVGIGVSNPLVKLDVNGEIKAQKRTSAGIIALSTTSGAFTSSIDLTQGNIVRIDQNTSGGSGVTVNFINPTPGQVINLMICFINSGSPITVTFPAPIRTTWPTISSNTCLSQTLFYQGIVFYPSGGVSAAFAP